MEDEVLIRLVPTKVSVKTGFLSRKERIVLADSVRDGEDLYVVGGEDRPGPVRLDDRGESADVTDIVGDPAKGATFYAVCSRSFRTGWRVRLGPDRNGFGWSLSILGSATIQDAPRFLESFRREVLPDRPLTVSALREKEDGAILEALFDAVVHGELGKNALMDVEEDLSAWAESLPLTGAFFSETVSAVKGSPFGDGRLRFRTEKLPAFESPDLERSRREKLHRAQKSEDWAADREDMERRQERAEAGLFEASEPAESGRVLLDLARRRHRAGGLRIWKRTNMQSRGFAMMPTIRKGDSLSFTLENPGPAGFLAVLNVDQTGLICPILPLPAYPEPHVDSGARVELCSNDSPWPMSLRETADGGLDHIVAIMSAKPLFDGVPETEDGALPPDAAARLVSRLDALDDADWDVHHLTFEATP